MADLQGYPTQEALEAKVREAIQNIPKVDELLSETHVYKLDSAIDPILEFRSSRFPTSDASTYLILHRPEIVDQMANVVLNHPNLGEGVFVRGPEGIGKSHSLTNLVQVLRAMGHLVTFVPNCERFHDHHDLIKFICRSMGSTPSFFGLPLICSFDYLKLSFIPSIVKVTGELGKSWILVFDQLNRIFARYSQAKDVGLLPQPFYLMKSLNSGSNVRTVIAASANNDVSYRENHQDFAVYEHPLAMSPKEISIWKKTECDKYSEDDYQSLMDQTGGIPLQVAERLNSASAEHYFSSAQSVVRGALRKLARETISDVRTKTEIEENAVRCLLGLKMTDSDQVYDRKHSIVASNGVIKPLFPAVLPAYRSFFWDKLIEFVESHEEEILAVCAIPEVSNDVRGRLFELVVIARFRNGYITSEMDNVVLPARVDAGMVFESQELPSPWLMERNTLFIPKNSNFPAVDLILKDGDNVWGIQVHVADHPDVLPQFAEMCKASGWLNYFRNIFLVYLGPSDEAKNSLSCLPKEPSRKMLPRSAKKAKPAIQVSATTIKDYECLCSIQWKVPVNSQGDDDNDNMEVSEQ